MMLIRAALLDDVALPRDVWIKIRVWILPPPQFLVLIVPAKHNVYIAIAVDFVSLAACFESQEVAVDHIPRPPVADTPEPNQCWSVDTIADDEPSSGALVQIRDEQACLLVGTTGVGQITITARQMQPLDFTGGIRCG